MTYYLASFIKEELEGVLNGAYTVKLKLQWADSKRVIWKCTNKECDYEELVDDDKYEL